MCWPCPEATGNRIAETEERGKGDGWERATDRCND